MYYDFTGQTGEKEIILGTGEKAALLFFLHDAKMKIRVRLTGEGAEVDISCIIVSAHSSIAAGTLEVILEASHTKADVYMVSLLGDHANATVHGGITIQPGLSKAEGALLEENILLGEKIVVDVKPLLDVKSNDVVASHGATIQRLDPQKVFYLNAKGLSGPEATKLMVQAYVQRAYDHVKEDSNGQIENICEILGVRRK